MTDFDDSNSFLVKVLSATPQKNKNSLPIVRILKDKIITLLLYARLTSLIAFH